MLLVTNTFFPRTVRVVGGALGAAFGVPFIAAGTSPSASGTALIAGLAMLVIGGVLGARFAPRAVRPGVRSAFATSALVTAFAVPLGAISVAASMATNAGPPFAPEAIVGVLALAAIGLIFLGLPMAGLTFVAANVWVALVRFAARRLIAASTR